MQDTAGVDQKASAAELIALLGRAQEEIEAHGELNELNLLLRDFVRELLKRRLQLLVEFVRMMELCRPSRGHPHNHKVGADYATRVVHL
jgi:hypothetical protein